MGHKASCSDVTARGRAENTGKILGGAAAAHRAAGKMFWAISHLERQREENSCQRVQAVGFSLNACGALEIILAFLALEYSLINEKGLCNVGHHGHR